MVEGNPPVFAEESKRKKTFFGTEIRTALATGEPETSAAQPSQRGSETGGLIAEILVPSAIISTSSLTPANGVSCCVPYWAFQMRL